jgi:hypothetical protein
MTMTNGFDVKLAAFLNGSLLSTRGACRRWGCVRG